MRVLKKRPYGGESDLGAIADLLNACELVDRLDIWISVSELRLEFEDPSVDKTKDFLLWENDNGDLIGFSQISIPPQGEENDGYLRFRVHPEARGGEIEKQMVAWGEQRMREVGNERGGSVKLRSGVRDRLSERIDLLKSCGFEPDRYFPIMERSLLEPIPEPQLPEGFTLRHTNSAEDDRAWVEMYNDTFIDHWNYHLWTLEQHQHWSNDPNYKPELDLIAIAPDGTFAAFCFCYIDPEENEKKGSKDGWVSALGTRRGFRRRGLGRAMLLAGMQKLKAEGMEIAKLGVDAENANSAKQLYESVGFARIYTDISFVKNIGDRA
jgi:mycothiol synthase